MILTVLAAFSYLRQSAAGQQEIVAERDRVVEAMNTLLDRRQYGEAIPYARRVLELQGQITGDNNELYAADLHVLGRLYTLVSQSDRAEPLYRKAVTVQRQLHGPDSLEYAAAQNSLGGVYDDMEFYDLAETYFRDALRIREGKLASDDPRYSESLSNLAWVDGELGKYDEAERLLLKSLEIDKTNRARSDANYCLHVRNLAQVYYLQTKYERAELLMREVIQIDDRLPDEDLGGNPAAARIEAANQRVTDKDKLGLIYLYLGRYKEAETSLLQAEKEEHAANLETHYLSSRVETHLALLYQSENRTKDALGELRMALEGQQKDIDNRIYELRAYAELIHYSLDGIVNVAIETHDDTATRLAFDWTLRRKALGLDVSVAMARIVPWYSDERDIYEKVDEIRELNRRIHTLIFNPPGGVDPDDARREVAVSRFTITRLQSLLDREFTPAMRWPPVDGDTVRASLPPGSVLIDFLVVPRLDFKAHGDGKRWASHYFAFVLSSDAGSKVRLIDIGDAHDIDRQVLHVREKIADFTGLTEEKQAELEYRGVSGDLYDMLFRKSGLKQAVGAATKVYVSPDGQLTRIPFETLSDKQEHGRYLAEDYVFIYLPSSRTLFQAVQPQTKRSTQFDPGAVVFAAPDYNLPAAERKSRSLKLIDHLLQGDELESGDTPVHPGARVAWKPLKGAIQEAKDITTALQGSPYAPVVVYQGPNALKEVFRYTHGARILHVATHGYFLPNMKLNDQDADPGGEFSGTLGGIQRSEDPLQRSGLVFAGANLIENLDREDDLFDGWMTAADVESMDLSRTELVVLSACDTGLGDVTVGSAVQGLQRSFLQVGARALIMSLYETPDDDRLMLEFYRLLAKGEDKAIALHKAQLTIIKERRKAGGAAHPYYWGSFIYVGQTASD